MVIRFFVKMMVDHQLVSVWFAYYLSIYYTIYLIFVTINDSHCTFGTFMGPIVLFQLIFTFIYNTFNKKFSVSTK